MCSGYPVELSVVAWWWVLLKQEKMLHSCTWYLCHWFLYLRYCSNLFIQLTSQETQFCRSVFLHLFLLQYQCFDVIWFRLPFHYSAYHQHFSFCCFCISHNFSASSTSSQVCSSVCSSSTWNGTIVWLESYFLNKLPRTISSMKFSLLPLLKVRYSILILMLRWDVYKRQLCLLRYYYQNLSWIGHQPVSYTHLDVYKRQPIQDRFW